MQFYTKQHKFYCGIDLHARKRNIGDVEKEHSNSLVSIILAGYRYLKMNYYTGPLEPLPYLR